MTTLADVVVNAVYADLPAAGISGRLFFASDTQQMYYDTGSAWVNVSPALNVAAIAALQQSSYTFGGADTGVANAYVVSLAVAPTLVTGTQAQFKAAHANTGASTLNLNGTGVKPIVKAGGAALTGGEIGANYIVRVIYDGANWQM